MAKIATGLRGKFLKGKDIAPNSRLKIVSEVQPVQGVFRDNNTGEFKMQNVGKVQIVGSEKTHLFRFNTQSCEALVDAFGEDSKAWVGKEVSVHLDKVVISGKRQIAPYLIPEGYEFRTDDEDYVVIARVGEAEAEA